ncbi:toxin-antitoxin system antitoxin component Xre family [Bacteroides intestinalis CAG:315]|jgi:predicted transcriptional regulator|uniref:Helix-turn-helix domain-containing protein n=1 Tax=Bacteroides intestinalis TaxID=329854 RepID=A0A412Y9A6_9BACE|nr:MULTISPECIES: helix-turn-helix domain-containing protein [Bacteroides]CDD91588.1 toxin-antitoxin system antitoxin component Xre family [Bacteroides intestinalis CAG:315]MCD7940524.1 helix-turn-helix domain-containing protein [Bacteroides intestinalis]RGV53961.1 helix-turn-helix domain-containing protein [Bacteroides intestinalis]RHA59791.1 helix-turn-helix domain-containing protein [Bacteroides intestinalis]RHL10191.1 helix-turn-helix domain-containing protein [Bacteroides sp. AF39-11AC]
MNISQIIKDRRLQLELTQQDLADYTELSLRIIKSIEAGKGNPTFSTLSKIAEILGLEIIMQVKEINK